MKKSAAAWCLALLLLCGALVVFNLPEQKESAVPGGSAAGQTLPDFSVVCLDGSAFSPSLHRGQVTVINLWATWCAPCIGELPYFDRLQREHPEDVFVLALHADPVTDDIAAWLSAHDYSMAFAADEAGRASALLGNAGMLPQTVILDREGAVVYNRAGSMTYETLSALVAGVLNGAAAGESGGLP